MKNSIPEGLKAALLGVLAVIVSLPLLWILHRAFGLGSLPITGIMVLGGTVIVCFGLAGVIGAGIGSANGNGWIAALLSLVMVLVVCLAVVPFYSGLVVEGLTRDATGLLSTEREQVQDAARKTVQGEAVRIWQASWEGRLREQLAQYQQRAQDATTPQARAAAAAQARELAGKIASQGKIKGIALLKSGTARLSSFAFLFWPLFGCPLVSALACKNSRRRRF